MNILLKLDKDFERSLEALKIKYGYDFEVINGISPSQLDFSEFIDNFVDVDTIADSSIDPNANANHKDIRSFMTEKGKSEDKLFGLNKIFVEIKKQWGLRTAKQWLEQEFSRGFYLNDSTTASYFPYCFSGDTKIVTNSGSYRLDELVDKSVMILNFNHRWENAVIKNFGVQPLRRLILEHSGATKEIYVTGNHHWFVKQGEDVVEYETDQLQKGMNIPYNSVGTLGTVVANWVVVSVERTSRVEDVYCAVTESGSFTLDGNILTHNCWANDFSRLATEGLFFLDNYNNEAPKHLTTYFDDVIEFVSFLSNRQSGAVGMPNVLIWAWYFWKKDVEDGYYMKDPDYYLRQQFQKLVYRLNQPFLRIDQSAFTNVSIFDRPYLESLFGGLEFPDGTLAIDNIEELIECQKTFMEVVSEIRETNMFTYPVLTYSLLYQNGKFVDEPFARWCSDHNIRWSDSNFFVSDNVGVLSNCPLSGDTPILYWSERYKEFKVGAVSDVYHNLSRDGRSTIKTLNNGEIVTCKINRFHDSADYKITLTNGASLRTTGGHLNKTLRGDAIRTDELTDNDYLPVSLKPYEQSKDMGYDDGMIVGMFLGDGSYRNGTEVSFSLNRDSKAGLINFLYHYCPSRFGAKITETECTSGISGKNSCVNINVNSKYMRGLIEEFVVGDNALIKAISYKAISKSMEFRRGILDGLYATDGGNSNRIYTSSQALKDTLITLLASMGIASTVCEDDRDGRLGNNTNYIIRYYTPDGRTKRQGVYVIRDGFMWFKVDKIERVEKTDVSYCLEVQDDGKEAIFMLPNGIHTHNCRLLSDTQKLDAFINSIGGTALSVGSCRVSTINLVRIAYESGFNKKKYIKILRDRVLLDCKALTSMRHIIQRNIEKGLLPNYRDGAVELQKQFCTIGGKILCRAA